MSALDEVRDKFCDCPGAGLPDDQHSPDGCHGLEVKRAVLTAGRTQTEWGVLFNNGNVFNTGSEQSALELEGTDPHIRQMPVTRQCTSFANIYTEWVEIERP